MSSFSDKAENAILNLLLQGTAWTPGACTLALFITDPTDAGGGTEVTGGNYARLAVADLFPVASGAGGSVANDAVATFATANANWGTVAYAGLMDAAGDLLMHASLDTPRVVNNGDTFQLAIGNLTFTVA